MKKITTTFIFMIFTSVLFSQQFGIKTGLNLTNVSGEDALFEDIRTTGPLKIGAKVAGFAQFGYGILTFTTEAGISQKGYIRKLQIENAFGSVKAKSTYNLNYLDLNTSANYYVSDMFLLNLGVGLSILLNGKWTEEYSEMTGGYVGLPDYESDVVIGEDVSAMDFGVNLGSTFYITEKLFLEANYYLGLATLDPDGNYSTYNNSIDLSCGYVF